MYVLLNLGRLTGNLMVLGECQSGTFRAGNASSIYATRPFDSNRNISTVMHLYLA